MRETRDWDWQVGQTKVADLERIRGEFSAVEELAVSPDGHVSSSAGLEQLVYLVVTADGQETLTPAEFASRYGWKNNPGRAESSYRARPADLLTTQGNRR